MPLATPSPNFEAIVRHTRPPPPHHMPKRSHHRGVAQKFAVYMRHTLALLRCEDWRIFVLGIRQFILKRPHLREISLVYIVEQLTIVYLDSKTVYL